MGWWHVCLLKHHNCRIKEGLKIALSVKFWAVIRGVGMDWSYLLFLNLNQRKHHQTALLVIWGGHLVALDPFGKRPVACKQHIVLRSIHTSVVRRHIEQCSPKRNSNMFHGPTFFATEGATAHRVMCAHKWPKRNVVAHPCPSFKVSEFI